MTVYTCIYHETQQAQVLFVTYEWLLAQTFAPYLSVDMHRAQCCCNFMCRISRLELLVGLANKDFVDTHQGLKLWYQTSLGCPSVGHGQYLISKHTLSTVAKHVIISNLIDGWHSLVLASCF